MRAYANVLGMAASIRTIYLCGPIMDAEPADSKDWRTRAKERLAGRFVLLDPLRRNFRENKMNHMKSAPKPGARSS